MKPARFEYHAPHSLEEALAILTRHAGEARLLAGGQSLIPMMNFRLASPSRIIDLNRIPALDYVLSDDKLVRIGAMTRQRAIEFSRLAAAALPLLRDGVKLVGHLPTRTRGTIGGSLAHADPAAEIPLVLVTLEAQLVARGPRGERVIDIAEFFRSALTTSLAADEILIEVRVPATPAGAGHAVEEFTRRHGDFAIAAVAASLLCDGGRCVKARLAAGGAGPVPLRLRAAEAVLEGEELSEAAIEEAAATAGKGLAPMTDHNASAEFRRHLTLVLGRRALRRAAAAAREGRR